MTKQKSTICSMTAFARTQDDAQWGSYTWEMRSVNHRYLETHFKLPEKLRSIEPALREKLRTVIARGKIECSLHFKPNETDQPLIINEKKVSALLQATKALLQQHDISAGLSAKDILNWPGVLQASELDIATISNPLLQSFNQTLEQLVTARKTEGARLTVMITDRLDQVEILVTKIRARMPEILAEQQKRIEDKIHELQIDIDRDRLAQEIVLVAQKIDVAEELDRLAAHVDEVRDTLNTNEPCGRRLDFLMQELNREANTLGSKSISIDSSQGAINLKVLIEQMREQIQNIE